MFSIDAVTGKISLIHEEMNFEAAHLAKSLLNISDDQNMVPNEIDGITELTLEVKNDQTLSYAHQDTPLAWSAEWGPRQTELTKALVNEDRCSKYRCPNKTFLTETTRSTTHAKKGSLVEKQRAKEGLRRKVIESDLAFSPSSLFILFYRGCLVFVLHFVAEVCCSSTASTLYLLP